MKKSERPDLKWKIKTLFTFSNWNVNSQTLSLSWFPVGHDITMQMSVGLRTIQSSAASTLNISTLSLISTVEQTLRMDTVNWASTPLASISTLLLHFSPVCLTSYPISERWLWGVVCLCHRPHAAWLKPLTGAPLEAKDGLADYSLNKKKPNLSKQNGLEKKSEKRAK